MTMRPSSHNRREDWGDLPHESSVVKALTGAGQASFRAAALSEGCSFVSTNHASTGIAWVCGCRASTKWAKAEPAGKTSLCAPAGATGVRTAARKQRTGRVNWGPSEAGALAQGQVGIKHKPFGGSQKLGCGHSKQRSCRTLEPAGEPRATGRGTLSQRLRVPLGRKSDYGIKRVQGRSRLWQRISGWSKPRRSLLITRLKPYWGKPAVRNFREGRGNVCKI